MPIPGMKWRHVTINTYGSWLPGDPRGWRSRGHKKHSTGDYRHPPARGEHSGLHDQAKSKSGPGIIIPETCREIVGTELVQYFADKSYRILAAAVDGTHAHLLVELPDDIQTIRIIVGEAKKAASRAVKRALPGKVWSEGVLFKPVETKAHHLEVFRYILAHVSDGAWVWSFRDDAS